MTNTNHHQCFQSNYAASHETNKTDSVTDSECFQSSILMVKNSVIQVTKKEHYLSYWDRNFKVHFPWGSNMWYLWQCYTFCQKGLQVMLSCIPELLNNILQSKTFIEKLLLRVKLCISSPINITSNRKMQSDCEEN